MSKSVKIAAIQMCSGINPNKNLAILEKLVAAATKAGATYVLTPEMSICFAGSGADLMKYASTFESNSDIIKCVAIAKNNKIFLHIGSLAIKASKGKYFNRSVLFSPTGEIITHYDKIHLFDASPPNDRPYKESNNYESGNEIITAKLPNFTLGFSICYDLRFPSLYNELCRIGAEILAIPAAFTVPTGKAHWEVLLRARAIETGSFVIAAAQGGNHENSRATFGHSMIIDPWGKIVASMNNDSEGFIIANIDISKVDDVRKKIPTLSNKVVSFVKR